MTPSSSPPATNTSNDRTAAHRLPFLASYLLFGLLHE
eukprot:CAMPEP_0172554132 /NCGR_PEP_ID=MMETSP1067-20121228/53316_1 /TAXON_ID=265564 ORGANISM="Thalassiosira punctigera, Strain Tpunct2005C2" /NCGR_SAMPLE_ID=MMETSP1067 /ASSEMBLY_ACC=CAM_ASM_000444 /LENGTH=36 /DNA_ID= /DNA_START= /DNA_END= /DNA_ORIENTATION=